jgi:methyltransferase (TIGR00027 family)
LDKLSGPSGSVVVRGRLGDEVLRRAYASGVRQVVTLGAGSDTRPWRLPLKEMRFFEVDLPGQLDFKATLLGPSVADRITVEADLRSDWPVELSQAGFDREAPAAWVLEGLLHYLDRPQSDTLRDKLSGVSAAGSWLTGDVPHTAFLSDPEHDDFLGWMEERGSPFLGTFTDPAAWLAEAGWITKAHQPADLLAGQCSLIPAPPARLFKDHRHLWYFHSRLG